MRPFFSTVFIFWMSAITAQTGSVQQPVEEQHPISYWWWVAGVLLAIGLGIAIYMLIKKDPRRDAVR